MNFIFAGILILAACVNSAAATSSAAASTAIPSKTYIRGCYYTNWSQNRPGTGQFLPENLLPNACTHIFFAFAGMDNFFHIASTEPNDQDVGELGLYTRVNMLKFLQPDLKTLLSFGGWLFSQTNGPLMHQMMGSAFNRSIFIGSAIQTVRFFKFDGFDFNWYPDVAAKDNFASLVKEFDDAIQQEASISNLPPLLLTVGVPPGISTIEAGYDGPTLAESVDWFNVMAFDYHGSWENQTGFNSPLYDRNGDGLSVNSTINYLINVQNIPANKLVLGLPAYGRGWTIPSTSAPNSIPSPAIGPSPAQPFTNASGVAAYFEICSLIQSQNYAQSFDDVQSEAYIFNNGVWIGYDSIQTFVNKINWLVNANLAGAFVWSLDQDDFLGQCPSSNGRYPLVTCMWSNLVNAETISTSTITTSTSTIPASTATKVISTSTVING